MKIVAIGGGNNSNIRKNGLQEVYEHENIDREIIKLSGKKKPNVLFVSHASDLEYEYPSYRKVVNTYGTMYHCPVKLFSIEMINNINMQNELLNWADIIYVGGGNPNSMMELWKKSGLDNKLKEIANKDKVLCGTSAGGGCWFSYMCSDYMQMETGYNNAPLMPVVGLGLVKLVLNPHANYAGRMKGAKIITELVNMNGISLTDNMAIEIVDDNYKLIKGISSSGLEREAILSYWENGNYYIEPIKDEGNINELIDVNQKIYKKKI